MRPKPRETKMRFWKALQNPFVLTLQGFGIGACLILAGNPLAAGERADDRPVAESVLTGIAA